MKVVTELLHPNKPSVMLMKLPVDSNVVCRCERGIIIQIIRVLRFTSTKDHRLNVARLIILIALRSTYLFDGEEESDFFQGHTIQTAKCPVSGEKMWIGLVRLGGCGYSVMPGA